MTASQRFRLQKDLDLAVKEGKKGVLDGEDELMGVLL